MAVILMALVICLTAGLLEFLLVEGEMLGSNGIRFYGF